MNKTLTIILCLYTATTFAQSQAKVSKGSIGIGFHVACPQSELKGIDYDAGYGIKLSYLTRGYPYKSKVNFQVGGRMDFANMRSKTFDSIAVEQPTNGVPIIGDAKVKAANRMYGLFALTRINYGTDREKLVPYIDLLAGHRNYNTYQLISLNKPQENPDYETSTLTDKVVYTKRFHFGAGVGVKYRINNSFSLDAGVTYTIGQTGAVLPLSRITKSNDGDEIDFSRYSNVRTDMLLVNIGLRIHLYKNHTYKKDYRAPSSSSTPSNTRYKDNTPTNTNTRKTDNPSVPSRNTPTPAPPVKKKTPIKIKPNGPKKDKNDRS